MAAVMTVIVAAVLMITTPMKTLLIMLIVRAMQRLPANNKHMHTCSG